MFVAILKTQWKWTRAAALVAFLAGFAIPVVSLTALQDYRPGFGAANLVSEMQQYAVLYSMLAAATGLMIALMAWQQDHRGRHVYAMALPITRAKYTSMRFAAGLLFLAIPVAGVLLGCLVGLRAATVPEGLHAYPFGLTIRFALAALVAYSVFFAISSATTRAAAIVLGGLVGIALILFTMAMMGVGQDFIRSATNALFADYGVFSVFTGRWMLIDV
jgi:hypothetical protein